jgi:hypothetical protein
MHAQRLAIRTLCSAFTRRAGRDRQAAWENPRQCGKPAGGTRRFSDDCSPGISPAIRSISPAACSPLGDQARLQL